MLSGLSSFPDEVTMKLSTFTQSSGVSTTIAGIVICLKTASILDAPQPLLFVVTSKTGFKSFTMQVPRI
jgi:hypothetical protein